MVENHLINQMKNVQHLWQTFDYKISVRKHQVKDQMIAVAIGYLIMTAKPSTYFLYYHCSSRYEMVENYCTY